MKKQYFWLRGTFTGRSEEEFCTLSNFFSVIQKSIKRYKNYIQCGGVAELIGIKPSQSALVVTN